MVVEAILRIVSADRGDRTALPLGDLMGFQKTRGCPRDNAERKFTVGSHHWEDTIGLFGQTPASISRV